MFQNENENEDEEKKKDIEIVSGDGKDLNISPVYNHIIIDKHEDNSDKKKNIVIPKNKDLNKK